MKALAVATAFFGAFVVSLFVAAIWVSNSPLSDKFWGTGFVLMFGVPIVAAVTVVILTEDDTS